MICYHAGCSFPGLRHVFSSIASPCFRCAAARSEATAGPVRRSSTARQAATVAGKPATTRCAGTLPGGNLATGCPAADRYRWPLGYPAALSTTSAIAPTAGIRRVPDLNENTFQGATARRPKACSWSHNDYIRLRIGEYQGNCRGHFRPAFTRRARTTGQPHAGTGAVKRAETPVPRQLVAACPARVRMCPFALPTYRSFARRL